MFVVARVSPLSFLCYFLCGIVLLKNNFKYTFVIKRCQFRSDTFPLVRSYLVFGWCSVVCCWSVLCYGCGSDTKV